MRDFEETGALEPHLFDRQLHACPECGSTRLVPVRDGADIHFFCEDCGRCWHVELGSVWRVDPAVCSGCEFLDRCAERFAQDHQTAGS